MNTTNLNKSSDTYEEQDTAASRLSSQGSVQMPAKPSSTNATPVTATASKPKSNKVKKAKDAFRTISEVADKLDVQQHVLRFWETKFSQVRPLKRGGGRRYYRPEDVALLERIHHLLYTEGYTIKGVQKLMKEHGKAKMIATQLQANNSNVSAQPQTDAVPVSTSAAQPSKPNISATQRAVLEIMLTELKAMRAMIKV